MLMLLVNLQVRCARPPTLFISRPPAMLLSPMLLSLMEWFINSVGRSAFVTGSAADDYRLAASVRYQERYGITITIRTFTSKQWRTEEGVRGLEPLPLAYDLRNKRVRMRQNMVFSTKIGKIFWRGRTAPFPDTSPMERVYSLPKPHPSAPAASRPLPF